MPVKRKTAKVRRTLDVFAQEHLELGEHLLAPPGAAGCWICSQGVASARWIWEENRAAILAGWRYSFPCFAQVVLDRAPLPAAEPTQAHERLIFAMVRDAAAATLADDA